jgi:hypothetical protein
VEGGRHDGGGQPVAESLYQSLGSSPPQSPAGGRWLTQSHPAPSTHWGTGVGTDIGESPGNSSMHERQSAASSSLDMPVPAGVFSSRLGDKAP